ncbi:MAG: hypothetical protein WCT37_02030 [Patescibacteria group bacterium]|jgi:hypothetical protein
MFDDAKKPDTAVNTEDIFSEVDQTPATPVRQPFNQPAVPPAPGMPEPGFPSMGGGRPWLKIVLVVLIVLAVVVLGAVAAKFLWPTGNTPAINSTPTLNLNSAINQEPALNLNQPIINQDEVEPLINEPVAAPLDSDSDGLTDADEIKYGTNPYLPDTDLDGLFDKEEIEIYKTNPLNADTDGDSYQDGAEVKGGYNPNGPGRLYSPAAPATNSNQTATPSSSFTCPTATETTNCMPVLTSERAIFCQWVKDNCPNAKIVY